MLILLVKNRPFPSCKNSHFLNEAKCKPGGGGALGLIFAGYVPLAS